MHACAHDMHITALLGTVRLLHENRGTWAGTFTALFQPAEELNNGAQTVVGNGLATAIPASDVALAQHILPTRAGAVGVAPGPVLSAADSLKITIVGRGGHGSMPHKTVDPVVIAGAIIMRLQTVVSRETQPGEFAVLTIGSVQAGTKANIIADTAELLVSVRSYTPETRERILTAIDRIVRAECAAAGAPDEPLIDIYETTPVTSNDPGHALRLEGVFKDAFGAEVYRTEPITASEDFGIIPDALGIPYVYWFVGGTDTGLYDEAAAAGTLDELPSNHSPFFAPAPTPALERATEAMTVAVMSYLGI